MEQTIDIPVSRTEWRTALARLIDEYRHRCLWFLRPDYMPRTPEEIRSVLDLIERYGDGEGYRRAEEIRAWL